MPALTAPVAPGIQGAAPMQALSNNGGIDTTYLKSPTETTDQYNTRIATYEASKNSPPSEPAVLSSDGATQRITDAQTSLANLSQKGTTIDPTTGTALYADGSAVPAPAGAVYNEKTGQYEAADGNSYSVADFYGANGNAPDADYTAIQNLFAPLKASLDANTLSSVNAIQQQYDSLRASQQAYNDSAAAARSRTSLLGGTTQYAPLDAAGIAHQQLTNGLLSLQSLDAKENAAIATAQQAQQTGDMNLMLDQIKQAETVRAQKQATAATIQDNISKANDALQVQRAQLQTENAVASALSSGMTDPAKILSAMTAAGIPATASDVASSLKNLLPTTTPDATYKFTNADVGSMLAAGMNAQQIQEVQDYYNGVTTTLPTLTDTQTSAVQKAMGAGIETTNGVVQSGHLIATPADITQGATALKASASQGAEADGTYADPNLYLQMFEHWINSGGVEADFFKYYPYDTYINPQNTWLTDALSEFKKTGSSASSSADASSSGEQTP